MSAKPKIPALRFKGFTEEWEERALGGVTDYKNGKGHEDKQKSCGKFELINLNSISIDGGLKSSGKFVDDADITLEKNDLVMILSDVAHGNLLGRVAIIPKDNTYVLNQRVALLRPNGDIFALFILYNINAHQSYFKSQGAGMSQLNISRGSVESFIIFMPKNIEQTKIGNYFQQLDTLIAQHQQKHDKLLNLKKALLEKMFPKQGATVPEIRFKGFGGEWEENEFSEIVSRQTAMSNANELPRVEYEDIISGKGRLNKNLWEKESSKTGIKFEREDILFGKLRPYLRNWLLPNFEGIAVGDFWVLRAREKSSKFIYSLIQTTAFEQAANLSSGSKMPRSDWGLVSKNLFRSPDKITEQGKIGEVFRQLDALIAQHQAQLTKLGNIKQACLEKMFV